MSVYSISRENAAVVLGISTRTIDRYIKSGKLSYKKVANKVLLNKNEIDKLKEDFALLHQEMGSELIGNSSSSEMEIQSTISSSTPKTNRGGDDISLDEKIDKFFMIFNEKEKQMEDKNKIIFMLQQRIGELEVKIQNMVALPDYTTEKQNALIEKEKLENKIQELKNNLKSERIKNIVYI
jgi:excisionase family DNA binding protein